MDENSCIGSVLVSLSPFLSRIFRFSFIFLHSTPTPWVFVGERARVETNAEQYFSVAARRLPINTDFARTARSTLPVLRYLERLNGTVNYRII